MDPSSVFYHFEPTSLGWLHRKLEKGDFVTAAELARIGHADCTVFADPVYQGLVLRALDGKLAKRRGRPPEDPVVWWKTYGAEALIEDRTAEIHAERAGRKARGSIEPREQAADEVARVLGMHMGGKSLLNRISDMKNPKL